MYPIDPNLVRILHISDLHRSEDTDFSPSEVVEALMADFGDIAPTGGSASQIDAVVVSGDLVQQGASEAEYQRTSEFLSKLYRELFPLLAKAGDRSRLVIVPGNHVTCPPKTDPA